MEEYVKSEFCMSGLEFCANTIPEVGYTHPSAVITFKYQSRLEILLRISDIRRGIWIHWYPLYKYYSRHEVPSHPVVRSFFSYYTCIVTSGSYLVLVMITKRLLPYADTIAI